MNVDASCRPDQPQPLAVDTTHGGIPSSVTRRGTPRRVTAICDAWRVDETYGREPIQRRYFAIVLDGAGDLVIFQDLVSGAWFERQD
jgi:hypothetical protein